MGFGHIFFLEYGIWSLGKDMHISHLGFIDFTKVLIKSCGIARHSSKSALFSSWGPGEEFSELKFGALRHLTHAQSGSSRVSKVINPFE